MTSPSTPLVLAVNAGSSTLKFALYPVRTTGLAGQSAQALPAVASGQYDRLNSPSPLRLSGRDTQGQPLSASLETTAAVDSDARFEQALAHLRQLLQALQPEGTRLAAVAHRIVHGGERCQASTRLDADTLAYLATLNSLAPLHQPHNLRGVQAFAAAFPDLPQIGCFDTGFHATLPEVERRLPLPDALADQGIRRYGFHGLSYRWLLQQLMQLEPAGAQGRWLLAHLGSGASLCAIKQGQSLATTMGFSALDGLMMGSRSGAIDPGVLLHLLRQGWDADALETLLYKQCGLLGVSGLSADMRTLRASDSPAALRAIELFEHRVLREAGAMIACLGGIDGVVFTGGIGEHDARLRASVCQGLAYAGVAIDSLCNSTATGDAAVAIHTQGSLPVWVIPTDEGRIAAQDAAALISAAA